MVSTSSWWAPHRRTGPIGIGSRAKSAGTASAPCRTCRSRTPGSSATRRARKCVPASTSFKRNDRPERKQEPKWQSPRRLRSRSVRKGTSRIMRPVEQKARRAMAVIARTIRVSDDRSFAHRGDFAEPHLLAARADLDQEARDFEPRPRAYRNDNREERRHRRQWVSQSRRTDKAASGKASEAAEAQAPSSPRPALRRNTAIHA